MFVLTFAVFGQTRAKTLVQVDIMSTNDSKSNNSLPKPSNTVEPEVFSDALCIQAARIVKFPAFYKPDPSFWFEQVEAAFHTHGITADETKFRYVILHADQEVLPHVISIARNPPDSNKYEAVKQRILSAFEESQESRLRRVLQGQSIGYSKPSHYLQHIRNTGGTQVTDAILRTLLLEQLPEQIRVVLGISSETDVEKLAKMADMMLDLQQPASLSTVKQSTTTDKPNDPLVEITNRLNKIEMRLHTRSRSGSRSRKNSLNRRTVSNNRDSFCYYHKRFGKNAKNCRSPCQWKQPATQQEN